MRAWFIAVVFLAMSMSPLVNHPTNLEDLSERIQSSSPLQTSLSASTGWITGGEEITITGSGFSELLMTQMYRMTESIINGQEQLQILQTSLDLKTLLPLIPMVMFTSLLFPIQVTISGTVSLTDRLGLQRRFTIVKDLLLGHTHGHR